MGRYFSNKNKPRRSNKRTNLIAILTIVVVLTSILLFFTVIQQQEKILKSYCGVFGYGSKSLVLMKDNTFRYNYYGCSQVNGHVSGTWKAVGDTLTFSPEQPDDDLDTLYQLSNTELVPLNKSDDEKFTLCDDY